MISLYFLTSNKGSFNELVCTATDHNSVNFAGKYEGDFRVMFMLKTSNMGRHRLECISLILFEVYFTCIE